MSDKKTETNNADKILKVSDETIALIRELVQLSILTGTNIVDHLRAIQLKVANGQVFPTEEYVNAYNAQIEELSKKAEEMQAKMQEQEATDNKEAAN